ncbi:protein DA1 [Actinosynnema sp. NPDC020468]|uniref:protein DA1 n=1 Tax=Actinosynnema sp. NPDC020468 TaxID=3154488 RepID=UPI0033CF4C22
MWVEDHFGETLCQGCAGGPPCWSCEAVTGGTGARARTVLADGRVRCARCSRSAVDRQSDVGGVVALVRPLLHSYGISLPNRVRVSLAGPAGLTLGGQAVHGLTRVVQFGRSARVVSLEVVSGLPATGFGRVLAHEMAHAWLARCPGTRSAAVEEGTCELVGSWWLAHRGGPLAEHLLRGMAESPDPLYGKGYRDVARRARGLAPAQVVRRVEATGAV